MQAIATSLLHLTELMDQNHQSTDGDVPSVSLAEATQCDGIA